MKPLKIVHCPTSVGGNPYGLACAERELGHDSRSIVLAQNYISYTADEIVFDNSRSWFANEIHRWATIWRVLRGSDVIHFNFGQSLAPFSATRRQRYGFFRFAVWAYNFFYASWAEMLDVRLARHLNKVIAVTYQGDDARQGDYCRKNYDIHFVHDVGPEYYNGLSDQQKRRRIEKFAKFADLIYAVNPDLMNVLPKRCVFIPYASVSPKNWDYIGVRDSIDIPHIIHAPSNRDVKGSKYIIQAIDRLKSESVPLSFTLVEGLSHEAAKKIYETADILVDQLLAGYYGALSVELMAMGKPVICYMREQDLKHMPSQMVLDLPVINASPDNIYDVLKYYLTDGKRNLKDIGKKSREYIETWHDPCKIASSLVADYQRVMNDKVGL